MRRRVRLTESQLRGVVEEASRRVIQEMIDEGWFSDTWNAIKGGASDAWNATKNMAKGTWDATKGALKTGWNVSTAPLATGNMFNAGARAAGKAAGAINNWFGNSSLGKSFSSEYQQGRQNQQPTVPGQYYIKPKQPTVPGQYKTAR